MKNKLTKLSAILLALMLAASVMAGCGSQNDEVIPTEGDNQQVQQLDQETVAEDGTYDSKEDVCSYLMVYGQLPDNYITKKEARSLGWEGGSLEDYAPGKCIGGDKFGNREGNLPKGEKYTECDIDTLGKSSRGAKRIVYSEDGDIYYTDDHYSSFEQLAENWEACND